MDPNRLKGKNILITGAARGMGEANAKNFAAQGANVCVGDLDGDTAQEVADAINAEGNGLTHHVVDAALHKQVTDDAVVGAEADAAAVLRGDEGQ